MRCCRPVTVGVIGFGLLSVGLLCMYGVPKLLETQLSEKLALVEGNEAYEAWKKLPFPLPLKIYLFNVTNAAEVQQGANPILQEIGPYVYDIYLERVNISVDEAADTITFMVQRTFFFNKKLSGRWSQDDRVTIVNGGLVTAALAVDNIFPAAMSKLEEAVPHLFKDAKDVFLHASVRDMLFDGLPMSCSDPEVAFMCSTMRGMLPPSIKFTDNGLDYKVAMLSFLNGTPIGPLTIGRGERNTTRGQVYLFLGRDSAGVWPGPTCNMLNGSDSLFLTPTKTPPPKIYTFVPEICRSIFINYEREGAYNGIRTWKYVNTEEELGYNGVDDCFCPRMKNEDYEDVANCPPRGLMDVTHCLKGPVLLSNPHFYLSDPNLLKYAQGLKPDKDRHGSFLHIEPNTLAPIAGSTRLQVNVQLKQFEDFSLMNNVSEGIFPMLWVELCAEMPEEYQLKLILAIRVLTVMDGTIWLLIVLGVLIIVLSVTMLFYKEQIMCFSNAKKVNVISVKQTNGQEPISNINFNTTVLYPSLYPQIENTNVTDTFTRRNNKIRGAWEFKN